MTLRVSSKIQNIHFPPISEVKGWISGRTFPATKPLVDLCQAIPDDSPPAQLLDHLKEKLDDPLVNRYSPDEGLSEVREEICGWYDRRYSAAIKPEEICLTIGASQAFWLAMTVLCAAGDEVILQLPAYFDHPMGLQAMGIKPVYAPYDAANGGLPDRNSIASLITPRTRAILLVTPSNPTGAVIPPELLQELFQLARKHSIALVLDETYNAFIGAAPHDLFREEDWGDTLVHLSSFGKTFALTGFRAGALLAAQEFIHHALKAQDAMAVCQPRITQHAVGYGCKYLDFWVDDNARMMQRRHDQFREAFHREGNPFILEASGSFFAWVRHPWPKLTGRQAARKLVDEANLICLPGEVFGPGLEGYLRLAFGNLQEANIAAAVERFSQIKNCSAAEPI